MNVSKSLRAVGAQKKLVWMGRAFTGAGAALQQVKIARKSLAHMGTTALFFQVMLGFLYNYLFFPPEQKVVANMRHFPG